MEDCVFCKIAAGKIETEIEKETENFIVFPDNHPSAPVHLLIVAKNHFADLTSLPDELWVEVKKIALELAKNKKLNGFRLATNAGNSAAVKHMHVHFLGEISVDREI